MSRLKVLIADDERDAKKLLSDLIEESGNAQIIDYITESDKIETRVNIIKPDVLFLDIKMPSINGLEILERIRYYNQKLPVVLVTAYDKYIRDAIKLNVFSYLIKPIDRAELNYILQRLLKLRNENIRNDNKSNKIKLPVKNGYAYLKTEELLLLEADRNYTHITTIKGDKFLSSYNLGRLFRLLPDYVFFRISRNRVLNSEYILRVNKCNKTCLIRVQGKESIFDVSNSFISFFNRISQ